MVVLIVTDIEIDSLLLVLSFYSLLFWYCFFLLVFGTFTSNTETKRNSSSSQTFHFGLFYFFFVLFLNAINTTNGTRWFRLLYTLYTFDVIDCFELPAANAANRAKQNVLICLILKQQMFLSCSHYIVVRHFIRYMFSCQHGLEFIPFEYDTLDINILRLFVFIDITKRMVKSSHGRTYSSVSK